MGAGPSRCDRRWKHPVDSFFRNRVCRLVFGILFFILGVEIVIKLFFFKYSVQGELFFVFFCGFVRFDQAFGR